MNSSQTRMKKLHLSCSLLTALQIQSLFHEIFRHSCLFNLLSWVSPDGSCSCQREKNNNRNVKNNPKKKHLRKQKKVACARVGTRHVKLKAVPLISLTELRLNAWEEGKVVELSSFSCLGKCTETTLLQAKAFRREHWLWSIRGAEKYLLWLTHYCLV